MTALAKKWNRCSPESFHCLYAYSVVDFKINVILFCAGDEVSTFIVELF